MTVSSEQSRIVYIGDGVSKQFSVPFYFLESSHIRAYSLTPSISPLLDPIYYDLVPNIDFTVTGAGQSSGGVMTLSSAIASGLSLTIYRDVPATQLTDYQPNDDFPAETHERALDKLTMLIQQTIASLGNVLSLNSLFNRWDFLGLRGVNAGNPINPQDVSTKFYVDQQNDIQDVRIDALSSGLPGTNHAFPWSMTTTAGTKTLTPGFEFSSAVLYIGGIAQTYGKSFAVAGNQILLAQAIPAGTEVYAILGQYVIPTARDRSRVISVFDFGAQGNGVSDDYPAFQAAIDSLPAEGGTINVPDARYLLSATPNYSTKSIYWMFGAASIFTGAGVGEGKFPYMATNPAQLAVGPYIRSRSSQHSTNTNGGIAATNAEMIQPPDYVGQSVAAYFGASGSNPAVGANVWALNTLVRAEAGALGTYQCIEVDVDNFAPGALVKGISISGAGTANPKVAIEIVRANNTPWQYGLDILNSVTGIRIRNSSQTNIGIVVGNPADQTGAVLSGQQLANSDDGVLLQRFTDTSPTGSFFRAVNAANSQNLFNVTADGSITSVGNITSTGPYVRGTNLDATGPVSAAPAGVLRMSASTSTTVGAAGAASALPATPLGYLTWNIGGTNVKIPYYSAT